MTRCGDDKDWRRELAARQQPPPPTERNAQWAADYAEGLAESERILGAESAAFAEGYADAAPSSRRLAEGRRRLRPRR